MNTIGNLAGELAGKNPQAAFDFLESLPYEDERRRALGSMGWQLARHHLDEAPGLIAASGDAKLQRRLAGRLTGEWSKFDREGALAWAETLDDEQARQNALRPVFQTWLQQDPQAAFAYMEATRETHSLHDSLSHAFGQWTCEDPAAATEALAMLPESVDGRRADIYNQVANYFVRHDPMAASGAPSANGRRRPPKPPSRRSRTPGSKPKRRSRSSTSSTAAKTKPASSGFRELPTVAE